MTSKPQALINDIVSYLEVLRNVYGITPEFIWNNINPTHRIHVNDDSIKRCDEWEHFDPENYSSASVNVGKESKFIDNFNECWCETCADAKAKQEAKDIQFNQAYE